MTVINEHRTFESQDVKGIFIFTTSNTWLIGPMVHSSFHQLMLSAILVRVRGVTNTRRDNPPD